MVYMCCDKPSLETDGDFYRKCVNCGADQTIPQIRERQLEEAGRTMSNPSKVTGGEWRLISSCHGLEIYSGGRYIATIPVSSVEHIAEEDHANARLLAASKDLREALEALLSATWDEFCAQGYDREPTDLDEVSSRSQSVKDGLTKARAALAKADGGSK